ncbi:hypothetical protein MtrunA17_Chr4g0011531 [Medicago truncatula]|uniref:Transmembrane protein n=1 Tax=Medicago truncatula TaxID=3880 RepID=A0A396I0Y6_MEDTR|nr:hypothetical protein MtrunA17_Chr4g0011531 [Medicago truncatula]
MFDFEKRKKVIIDALKFASPWTREWILLETKLCCYGVMSCVIRMTMTFVSSTLQIWRHKYFGDMNIVILVIFISIGTLLFYAINMDIVSLFTNSSFLFLANLDLYCINVLYQFE